jgi:RNase H-like domain found in reverse transcriptase
METTEMTELLKNKTKRLIWTRKADEAFENMKTNIEKKMKIRIADREGKFAIVCDASLKGIGGILIPEEPKMKLLKCFSKTLGKHEKNYSTIEKELYLIVKCLEN